MKDITQKYFSARAANAQREAEMQAFYDQTMLEPILEELADIKGTIAEFGGRIAEAIEKLATQREDSWLPPKPSAPPVESESPDPTYTDDEMNWVREEAEKQGATPPYLQRLFGEQESAE